MRTLQWNSNLPFNGTSWSLNGRSLLQSVRIATSCRHCKRSGDKWQQAGEGILIVEDLYYKSGHLNLKYKSGALLNRITARDVCGIRPQDIEWIWIVEEKRNATQKEIRELCKPKRQTNQSWDGDRR